MKNLFLPLVSDIAKIATDDYVGFTFFVGCMAMMAASAFFFLSLNQFDKKWRTSVLVSGLITFIAAVHLFLHERLLGFNWRFSNILQICGLDFNCSANVR